MEVKAAALTSAANSAPDAGAERNVNVDVTDRACFRREIVGRLCQTPFT
jgi:hypothetical protein